MPDPSTIFAWIVATLAGLATIGALTFAVVWEVCAIRRTLAEHRRPPAIYVRPSRFDPTTRYWREHSAVTIPEHEQDEVRDGTTRVLAGEGLRDIAKERRP
jgi:hypothetical protein